MGATNDPWRSTIRRAACALVALSALSVVVGAGDRRPPVPPPVVTVAPGGESIPTIRTGRGVTTMLSLPEEAREAICGDLFDAQTGNGGYVIQRSGRDIFLKPLRAAGGSNLFVKTERATYAFELVVVPAPQAMRIVRVEPAPPSGETERDRLTRDRETLDAERAALAVERAEATAALDRRRAEIERDAGQRAEALAREWIVSSVRDGGSVVAVTRRTGRGRDVSVELGGALVVVGGRGYLSCAIRNRAASPVTVASALLSGVARIRSIRPEVVSPGATVVIVLETDAAPARDAELRLVDPSGAVLVAFRPFR